ncbi:hypothetical protein [Methylocystis sp. ATCC 49242]|uniref:hypothetical protein n=1 Tax=Methylocystis sp. ATCC 49242 TaxID=622637 RepID=UPI0001F8882D|nr:hypothetical protein [Methylocystis sp. ATCC 49242]
MSERPLDKAKVLSLFNEYRSKIRDLEAENKRLKARVAELDAAAKDERDRELDEMLKVLDDI